MGQTKPDVVRQTRQQQLVRYAPYFIIGIFLVILPSFASSFMQSIMAKAIIFGIFAMSLNLIWGYTGLMSLGHAAFFGVGGYTAGILIMRYGIESFWLVTPAGILMAALLAAIIGLVVLRVSGAYFLLLTMAMGQLLYGVALKWRGMTGGNLGLFGVSYPELGLSWLTMNATSFYYLVFVVFAICFFLMYRLLNSPFGYALQGIREDERRMRHLGYNTWLYKYIAFVLAGLFAGVAGVLFGYYNKIIVPDHLGVINSALVLLMVIIGGERVIFGPALGAVVIILLQYYLGVYYPERWPLALGGVFILVVMFLRGGISIYLVNLWERLRYSFGSSKS